MSRCCIDIFLTQKTFRFSKISLRFILLQFLSRILYQWLDAAPKTKNYWRNQWRISSYLKMKGETRLITRKGRGFRKRVKFNENLKNSCAKFKIIFGWGCYCTFKIDVMYESHWVDSRCDNHFFCAEDSQTPCSLYKLSRTAWIFGISRNNSWQPW